MDLARLSGLRSVVDLGSLIARKRHGQAAEALRAQLERQAPTVEMRFQYADLLVRADRGREATPILLGLADELLAGGVIERSIEALRMVLSIDPHADLKTRLGALSRQIHRGRPRRAAGVRHEEELHPLRAHFGESRWSPRMRLRLAGLVRSTGDPEAAAAILMSLAHDLAEAGLAAQALAIMEGVERPHAAELHLAPEDSFETWLGALLREQWATEELLPAAEP